MSDKKNASPESIENNSLPVPLLGRVELELLPVTAQVLFPHNVMPLVAGKDIPADLAERFAEPGKTFGVVLARLRQEDESSTDLIADDLFRVGTQARVLKVVRFPDGTTGLVVQGVRRFRIQKLTLTPTENRFTAEVGYFLEPAFDPSDIEMAAFDRSLKQLVHKAIALSPNIPDEAAVFVENIHDPNYLSDVIVPYLSLAPTAKQEILAMDDLRTRLKAVIQLLTREIEVLEFSQKIHSSVRSEINKQQRRYYVREQMRLLQKELGDLEGNAEGGASRPGSGYSSDSDDLHDRVEKSAMPEAGKDAARREIDRMQTMQPGSPEFTVSHTYVNTLLEIPWGVFTQGTINLSEAQAILDADHYGLDKVKRRITEFLAVYSLRGNLRGPILLLVGPPGVGKTSLGRSVARALGRKFARISLGGVRDEAEIRGHRRTYIGSLPGKIVDAIKKAGSQDPVILLDEVDKLGADHRGDPASALLEVLDSEQNHAFVDHYLNVPIDLSHVLFICTANNLYSIPDPLRDRMELIELSGYTLDEKLHIAFDHLLPKVVDEHGLGDYVDLRLTPAVMGDLVQRYTREAGVRQLRRELANVARSVAHGIVTEGIESTKGTKARRRRKTIDKRFLHKALGAEKFLETQRQTALKPGVATGLAYTSVGGDVLYVETVLAKGGSGKINITGQLGDVMRESVQTALSYILANREKYGIKSNPLLKKDLHIHFPEGAVKKDGPSAGVAIFLALIGLFRGWELSPLLAMTGEISLRGDILPVGGIKEKLVAAHRHGVRQVLIPRANQKDLEELPAAVRQDIQIELMDSMDDAFSAAFPAN